MTLRIEDFDDFFAAVHPDARPFLWQRRLLEHVVGSGRWPDQIVAPTGAGKTAVIDIHVFAVALHAAAAGPRVPRRLALVVDRRALVDDQFDHARALAGRLLKPDRDVLREVARLLSPLRWAPRDAEQDSSPLMTVRLRGGLPAPRGWRDDPTACAVVCATPAMWGSRLLLRGYGSTRNSWPREAGLLAYDAVLVVDEAHLSRQLVTTARRVAELQRLDDARLGVPGLQVVETSATPDSAGTGRTVVGVEADDLGTDVVLSQRLRTPKPVRVVPVETWPLPRVGPVRRGVVDRVIGELLELRQRHGATIGCFVSTVDLAADVYEALSNIEFDGRAVTSTLLCGRQREFDLLALRRHQHPGLLSLAGDARVDVIVATQTLEVGVDIDLAAALTDIAPGTSLAQRAGRVNRLGKRHHTEVAVLVPSGPLPDSDRAGPYRTTDLYQAIEWLRDRADDPSGLAPWTLTGARPPGQEPSRLLFQRLELSDAWQLARTGDRLAAEPDIDWWLSDDQDEDTDVGFVVRRMLPLVAGDAARLIRDLPPQRSEVYPATLREGREILWRLLTAESTVTAAPPVLVRGDEIGVIGGDGAEVQLDGNRVTGLRPGDLIVVDDQVGLLRAGVAHHDGATPGTDVSELVRLAVRVDPEVFPNEHACGVQDVLDIADTIIVGDETDPNGRILLAKALAAFIADASPEQAPDVEPLLELLAEQGRLCTIVVHRDEDDRARRLIVVDARQADRDEEIRQVWSRRRRVSLTQHSDGVAQRAQKLAAHLGLDHQLVEVLRLAGLHHDDGKADQRFQVLLGRRDKHGVELAKSGMSDPARVKAAHDRSGLPPGWRHEQLSVQRAWAVLRSPAAGLNEDLGHLAIRLVGTSHGHGRHGFPHVAADLLGPEDQGNDSATDLFDEGVWDELIESTHRRWGVWGCAYLEALLRAADGQVSREGS